MKAITIVALLAIPAFLKAQVSDLDIVKLTLGKKYGQLHKTLDSLGVWYALHLDNDKHKSARGVVDFKKMYSISDGKGSVKVWAVILNQNTNVVDEIVINYRHDSKEQVEDSRRLKDFTDFHVGLYSTDFVFQWKSTGIKKP
ncbi:MAG TPA: hypothetical protein VEW65_02110 [Chryseolinea sp.]|jgi:hypothetical protein|nr:hypothetical protein [Chryseolinea sp.]